MRQRRRWITIAGAALMLLSPPSAGAVTDRGITLRLLEAPQELQDDPRAQSYVIDNVRPGTAFTRKLSVRNDGTAVERIALYVAPSTIENGAFVPAGRGATSELSSWLQVSPTSVDLQPGSSSEVMLSVRVPQDVSNGERYGAVFAEISAKGAAGVGVSSRVGVRVYLSVSDSSTPISDFNIEELTASRDDQGKPVVRATVRNTGGRALDLGGVLRLSEGPGGLSAGPFEAELGTTLAPADTGPVTVKLDEALPAGPWLARLELQSGLLKRAAEATITFPDQGEAAPVDAELVEDTGPPWLWIALGAGLLLALALLLLFLLKRRGRRDDDDDKRTAVVVAPPA